MARQMTKYLTLIDELREELGPKSVEIVNGSLSELVCAIEIAANAQYGGEKAGALYTAVKHYTKGAMRLITRCQSKTKVPKMEVISTRYGSIIHFGATSCAEGFEYSSHYSKNSGRFYLRISPRESKSEHLINLLSWSIEKGMIDTKPIRTRRKESPSLESQISFPEVNSAPDLRYKEIAIRIYPK